MYAWIWHKLPFGLPGKLATSVLLVAAVAGLLWYVVFPWATPLLPFDDVQVGTETGIEQGVPGGENADVVVPGEEDAPEEIPYSVESNEPHPSKSPNR